MGKVMIIAEAGVNHNGDLEIAKKLIDKAAECGADVVKFQTFKTEDEISKHAIKADYQKITTGDAEEGQLEMCKRLEISPKNHEVLIEHCKKRNIKFLSTPFEVGSVDVLVSLGLDTLKIPSGEINNLPYLEKIGKLKKKIILSTGMSNLGEVEKALQILQKHGTIDITVLHCTTEYPAPFKDVNLRAMVTMGQAFGLPVGYSDHTTGIEASIAAVALGATVIEKHFTLDKNMEGPDHKASIEPEELRALVSAIRNIELALGDGIKKISPVEEKNLDIVRKSIVANRPIKKGEPLTEGNITTKRPATGITPMRWHEVVGTVATRDYETDDFIK